MPQPDFETLRERMVRDQLAARDITDPRVLEAMRRVPRHRFVPPRLQSHAYEDTPLPIGSDQTISQPYVVALMTQLLEVHPHETILEIGTGSGYQTAVLCELAQMVYSLERHSSLADEAQRRLADLGYHNVEVFVGDGSQGFPDMAPFDGILAAAAAPAIPGPLQTQLADGGRLVIPIGDAKQQQTLQRVRRQGNTWRVEETIPVMFVPLFGRYGFKDDSEDSE
ncbi:protein-L-isoaspartate(D-aspartate) O-methyltransferase [Aggregatilinea lenta]|uniref:protein-L-isoaspartate(D-aspartate) O-methyltransferase n=1 Tax=Aggregatilinea lenta TaxID=913108 RepID=UPI001EE8E32E|nr:protein-L-isoaspartate(D-aspartate) O-methyltransferase [Aggregatilinea lenta]